ncbi:hypothetical protein FRC10_008126 [Ceratobasidium sp. 414]|nr:hypothetical protein FRC10_008126 [Ceratobasidium sp. 414]
MASVLDHKFPPGTQIRVLPRQAANGKLLVTSAQLARHMHSELDGWVTSSNGELLIWLPPDLRGTDESLICISPQSVRRQVIVDFSAFVHGSSWTSIVND